MSSGPTKARHGAGRGVIGPTVLPSPEAAQLVGLRPRRRAPALRSVVFSGATAAAPEECSCASASPGANWQLADEERELCEA